MPLPIPATAPENKTPEASPKKKVVIKKPSSSKLINLKEEAAVSPSKVDERKDKEVIKSEMKSKKKTSVMTSMLLPPKDDVKVGIRRVSKFNSMVHPENQRGEEELMDESGKIIESNLTKSFIQDTGKSVIRFRSKSKEKKTKRAYEDKMSCEEEKVADERKRKFSLGNKLKAQFDRVKLSDLKTPAKLENHVDEKFIRDKSEITKNMEKLTREIKGEQYTEKDKLALNIFEDFEKQESWQSYTTLLFADLSKIEADKKKDDERYLGGTKKIGKTSTMKK